MVWGLTIRGTARYSALYARICLYTLFIGVYGGVRTLAQGMDEPFGSVRAPSVFGFWHLQGYR